MATSRTRPEFVPPGVVYQSTGNHQTPREWMAERWRTFVVRPVDLEVQALGDVDTGSDAGLYFLEDEAGGLLYVGLSNSIHRRLAQHAKAGVIPFTHVRVMEIEIPPALWDLYIESIEAAYIHALQPPFNNKYANGRLAEQQEMVAAIVATWVPT